MARTPATRRAGAPKVDLDALFAAQRGMATRRQLLAAGLDDEAIRREVHGSRWQRVLPGLFACFTGPLTLEHRRVAAILYGPEGAQITGVAALRWHGLRHVPADDVIHLLIPHGCRRASRGLVRFQRTHRLDPHAKKAHGYAVCSVARAVADAARFSNDLREVRAFVAEAIQRGLTTVAAVRRELRLAASHRTRLLRAALNEVDAGARSAPEAELADELDGSRVLPRVVRNPRLSTPHGEILPSPDGWIEESGIAIEVDSREYHLSPEDWQRTLRRHNALTTCGALVLHFTPSEVRRSPGRIRRMVEKAHVERVRSGARASVRQHTTPLQEGSPVPG
jgi:hypothetical protein